MSSISEGIGQLIDRIVENDRRHARRTGLYIDATRQVLNDAKQNSESSPPVALPATSSGDFKGITDADIKKLLRAYGVKGYTQRDGKKLARKDRVQLAIDNKIPALSYDFLLNFYVNRQV